MWISDIARGADQLDFGFLADSGKHIATDTLVMYGANVGIEWQF